MEEANKEDETLTEALAENPWQISMKKMEKPVSINEFYKFS